MKTLVVVSMIFLAVGIAGASDVRCGNEFIGKGTSIDTVMNNCTVTSSYSAGTVAAWDRSGGAQCDKMIVNIVEDGFYGAKTPYRIVFYCGRVASISRTD